MFDLARGLLKAQVQAYRHRLKLSENGVLPLYHSDTDSEPYYVLDRLTQYSYFRSLQQLWIVLQTCPDDEQIINRLTWDRCTMFNSLDIYVGFKFVNSMG